MKKATVAAVAQEIKGTTPLSQLQGLAPAKSCKPPLKSSTFRLTLDAAQAHLHLDLLGLYETSTNIRLIPHKGSVEVRLMATSPWISNVLRT